MPREDTETVVYEPRRGPSLDTKPAGVLTLDFASYRTMRNTFVCLCHPVYGILFIEAKATKADIS